MNAKTVLKKLVMMLSSKEENLTYAKLGDGTIVESLTFDVGEKLFVISEDGEKTPAPNGEHELSLRDEEGKETLIKVITEDGVIRERENVELADLEIKKAEDIPATGPNEMPTEMSEETYTTSPGDIPTTGDGIPADITKTTMEEKDIKEMVKELSYRIEEMEKKIKMGEHKKEEEEKLKEEEEKEKMKKHEDEMEDEELPKLDGAPVEARIKKLSSINTSKSTPGLSPQERVLARLYNNK